MSQIISFIVIIKKRRKIMRKIKIRDNTETTEPSLLALRNIKHGLFLHLKLYSAAFSST